MKNLFFILLTMFSVSGIAQTDSTVLLIQVTDYDKVPEQDATIKIMEGGKVVKSGESNLDGMYATRLAVGKTYTMLVSKFDTTFNMGELTVPSSGFKMKYNQRLKIKYIVKDYEETYELDVYFKTNEHILDLEDIHALKALYDKMVEKPLMRVEIAAHTDNVGNDKFNMRLSQKRANSVREHLIGRGIDPARIVSKGYGETQPTATNDTAEGREKNRRVEVRIVNY